MESTYTNTGLYGLTQQQIAGLAAMKLTNPTALAAILEGTNPMCAMMAQTPAAAKPSEPVALPKVGEAVEGRGVYLGPWEAASGHTVHAYAAEDFLRDANGNQLVMTFVKAREEFARRNFGWEAGNGTEAALRAEIAKGGNEFEGKLIIPPLELVNGYNLTDRNNPRTDGNIYALMNAGKLPKVAAAVQTGSDDQRWALSGSEHPGIPSRVYHVRLPYGANYGTSKGRTRSGAVPVRFFRQPTAAGPAPQVVG